MNTNSSNLVNRDDDRVTMSYFLWLLGLFGLSGLHRLYNGKIGSGLFWFCTWGVFGVGQMVDLFLVPNMTEEYHLKRLAKYGGSLYSPAPYRAAVAQTVAPPTEEQHMLQLLKAAQEQQGSLSVTQGVLATGLGFDAVETLLQEMHRAGYVSVENHPKTGVVLYRFDELAA